MWNRSIAVTWWVWQAGNDRDVANADWFLQSDVCAIARRPKTRPASGGHNHGPRDHHLSISVHSTHLHFGGGEFRTPPFTLAQGNSVPLPSHLHACVWRAVNKRQLTYLKPRSVIISRTTVYRNDGKSAFIRNFIYQQTGSRIVKKEMLWIKRGVIWNYLTLSLWLYGQPWKKGEKNSWCMHFTSNNAICLFLIPSGSLALPQQQNEKRCYQFSIVVVVRPAARRIHWWGHASDIARAVLLSSDPTKTTGSSFRFDTAAGFIWVAAAMVAATK